MSRAHLSFGILMSLAVSSWAVEAFADYVADNHSWTLACNSSGYQLKSKHPVARFFEAGADSRIVEGVETLYLGRSCDATHSVFGQGEWCWANGGFRVDFKDRFIGFPRQELSCPDSKFDLSGCGC